jgi:lysophospholipase L1-like esterase
MAFYALVALVALVVAAAGFCLTDGGVRLAVQFALARRIGFVFAPKVIVVGDSLAAGCPWRKLYRRPFATLNLAAGGATIKEIAGQIYRARDIRAPWLLVDGGLNDLLFDSANAEQIECDYSALFRRIGPNRRVIVTLMPHVVDPAQTVRIDDANCRLLQLCAARGYEVIDLNPMISKDGVRAPDMTPDGLHFSSKAEQLWRDAVRSVIYRKNT